MSDRVKIDLRCGDCLPLMATLPADSINLIVADPPYFKVKNLPWDRQWDTVEGFISWIGRLCEEWRRILKPNGSLYVFASPRMAARVEVEIGKWFSVLSNIVWAKPDPFSSINRGAGNGGRICKDSMRQYYPNTERINFAEHCGADGMAKGEAGYGAKCDELRGFVFEPIRAYLESEKSRLGLTNKNVNELLETATNGSGMAGHYFKPSGYVQWELPTELHYQKLQNSGGFSKPYEDLRREYEDLRREYEDLRRPFSVSADVPYTDVWDFPTVKPYPGKHPCEKPRPLIAHIITASSHPGDVVLDPFLGSGVTGEACVELGRDFIGFEQDETYFARAKRRIKDASDPLPLLRRPEPSASDDRRLADAQAATPLLNG